MAVSGSILLSTLAAAAGPLLGAARNANAGADAAGGIMAMLAIYLVVVALIAIPTIIGMWKAFAKAGQPGWAAIIPIYNVYVMNAIGKKEPLWFILYIVGAVICGPLALVAIVVINVAVAEKFGKGAGYGIGLSFLPFIFWPMLGFGDARYKGGRRRDYDDYDDEEEEEEDERPRKKSARDYDDEDDDRPRKRKSRDYDD